MRSRVLLTSAGAASLLVGSSAAVLGLAPGTALAAGPCGSAGTTGASSCTYAATGVDTFTVPAGVTQVAFTLYGGQGGSFAGTPAGGKGGRVTAVLLVSPHQVFQVNVGGKGLPNTNPGGINNGSGGGGGSDVRTTPATIATRVLVAGGGGGTGGSKTTSSQVGGGGGNGGGGNGSNGSGTGLLGGGGGGATISVGGTAGAGTILASNGVVGLSFSGGVGGTPPTGSGVGGTAGVNGGGQGGVGVPFSGCPGGGGGGGGGYFGGGGGGATSCANTAGGGGGGGGSNYVTPTAVSSTNTAGVRSGNGEILVTWKSPTTLTLTPHVSGVSLTAVAHLSGPSGPLSGQTIIFTAGPTHLCTVKTNSSGNATCKLPLSTWKAVYIFGVTATYAGNSTTQGATVTRPFPI